MIHARRRFSGRLGAIVGALVVMPLGAGLPCLAAGAPAAEAAKNKQPQATPPVGPRVEVWKSPTCGCCQDWVVHMQTHGFEVVVHDTGNTAMRRRLGIDMKYGSCHTARVQGYALEGHVPAADVRRLLRDRPQALGLAVPGMPIGSPGMDGPEYGTRRDAYDVLLLQRDGSAHVWQHHPAA